MKASSPPVPHHIFHVVAVFLLAVVAVNSLLGLVHQPAIWRDPFQRVLTPIFGVGMWAFLIWKLWRRPRKWGLGIGIFLLLVLGFQTWLMILALRDPHHPKTGGVYSGLLFALGELPIAAAAVACLILRIVHPREHPDSGNRLATDTD
jgi:hypothetical protein